jgi:hypothetical protein
MHCLGAVTGGGSPNGVGGGSGVLSVFRALGVLVCEGRIQGPPRGYKEGPHCAPPMQAVPNDHVCEESNYLVSNIWCPRYSSLFLGDLLLSSISSGLNHRRDLFTCRSNGTFRRNVALHNK